MLTTKWCTQRQRGIVVVVDTVDQYTMVAADKRKTRGTEEVPTTVDPPQVGGVTVVPEANRKKPPTVGIVARKVRWKVSDGKRRSIRIEPN